MPDAPAIPGPLLHALCVYAEPLVQGRRVLVIDDASRGLGARLLELGARLVHAYDPSASRAREAAADAPRALTVRELPAGDFEVREGAFDVAVVPDLAMFAEPAALLARVRRLLGAEGVMLVAAENAEARPRQAGATGGPRAVDYYELYDLVALQFASVRMIGVVPFVGVALAELGIQGDPEVSVDTQLAGEADPPHLFVALASQDDRRLAEYAIVQLPSSALVARPSERAALTEHVALAEAQLRASVLTAQLEEALARGEGAEESERERRALALQLQASFEAHVAQLKEAEARAAEHYRRAERVTHDARQQEEELLHERRVRARLELEIVALRDRPDAGAAEDRASSLQVALRAAEEAAFLLRGRLGDAEARAGTLEEQVLVLAAALEQTRVPQVRPEQLAELARRAEGAEARAAAIEAQLGRRAEAAEARARALEAELARRAEGAEARAAALEADLGRRAEGAEARVAALEAQLGRRADGAEARAAALEAELATISESHATELVSLETALRERGKTLSALEHEVVRRQRLIEELVSSLEELHGREYAAGGEAPVAAPPPPPPPPPPRPADVVAPARTPDAYADEVDALRAKLDALALDAARREGDLTTSGWRIAELERQLALREAALATASSPPVAGARAASSAEVGRLQDELDALRQALTQEHEARTRAESGDDLAKARAELAQQAVLIEQLSRELEGQDRVRISRESADRS